MTGVPTVNQGFLCGCRTLVHRDPRGAEGLVDGAPGGCLGFEAGVTAPRWPQGCWSQASPPRGRGAPFDSGGRIWHQREAPWAREDVPTLLSDWQIGRGGHEARGGRRGCEEHGWGLSFEVP